jgi:hypothetical protein
MALIPLNTFKTKTTLLTTATTAELYNTSSVTTIYTAPVGVTSIVLMAQISNISNENQTVTVAHWRNKTVLQDAQGYGFQAGRTPSILVRDFIVPPNDAASVLTGKLIIEELDSIRAYASSTGTCQVVLSILETANE